MMKTLSLILAVAASAACASHAPAVQTPVAGHAGAPAAASVLAIQKLDFYSGNELGMKLGPDGALEVMNRVAMPGQPTTVTWQQVATLHADGTLTGKGGKSAMFKADGTLTWEGGELAELKLDGDAMIYNHERVTIDEHGAFLFNGKPDDSHLRVVGVTDAASRRTALLLMALLAEYTVVTTETAG